MVNIKQTNIPYLYHTVLDNLKKHLSQRWTASVPKQCYIDTATRFCRTENTEYFHSIRYHLATYEKKRSMRVLYLVNANVTSRHIELRKAWARAHLRDNWARIIFTDETAFDLFRNKVSRWHKSGEKLIRRLPKSNDMGGFRKGKTPLCCCIEYNGWAFLCRYIADISAACCSTNVWQELASATRQ